MTSSLLVAVIGITVIAVVAIGLAIWRGGTNTPDVVRVASTFGSAAVGLLLVFIIFDRTLSYAGGGDKAKDALSIAGTAIAMIGTLVGFVAGHTAGAAGKTESDNRAAAADQRADRANEKVQVLSAYTPPDIVQQAMASRPDLFS